MNPTPDTARRRFELNGAFDEGGNIDIMAFSMKVGMLIAWRFRGRRKCQLHGVSVEGGNQNRMAFSM